MLSQLLGEAAGRDWKGCAEASQTREPRSKMHLLGLARSCWVVHAPAPSAQPGVLTTQGSYHLHTGGCPPGRCHAVVRAALSTTAPNPVPTASQEQYRALHTDA